MAVTAAPGVPDNVKAGIQSTLDSYLRAALVVPLRTGQPPAGVEALFAPPAAAGLQSADRASLVEDHPAVLGDVSADRAEATLTPLAAPDGSLALVAAHLDVTLTVTSRTAGMRSTRSADLVLAPLNGTWVIDSYDVSSNHDSLPRPGRTATTGGSRSKP